MNSHTTTTARLLALCGLTAALAFALLIPAAASAHFVRPFVRQFTGTPTGPEGGPVPFAVQFREVGHPAPNVAAGPYGVAVDGEGDVWILGDREEGYEGGPRRTQLDEFGPSGAYRETLEPSFGGGEPSYGDEGKNLAIDTSSNLLEPFAGALYLVSGEEVHIFSKAGVLEKSFHLLIRGSNSPEDATIAVDNSTEPLLDPSAGDVYVQYGAEDGAEDGTSLLKYNAAGEPKNWEGFKGSEKCGCGVFENEIHFAASGVGVGGVAVDPADGDIWVGDGSKDLIEFTPGGELIREITPEELASAPGIGPEGHGLYGENATINGLAVDPTNGDLLVALSGREADTEAPVGAIDELNSSGVFLGQIAEAAGQRLDGAFAVAFDSSGDLYVVNHDTFANGKVHAVEEYGAGHFIAAVRPAAATARTQAGAVLNGFVDPESKLNIEEAGVTDCHFEYVSEAAFKANDVNEAQSVTLAGASGGMFSLGLEGQSTAATGTGDLVGPASGTGDLIEGSNTIIGVSATSGEFVAGTQISGQGIPAGATILLVHAGIVVLSADATASGGGVALSAVSDEVTAVNATAGAFAAGEELSGAGIPAGTTIAKVGPGKLTLSADVTAPGTGVALSAALAYDSSARQVQSALEALAPIGAGNVAVSGEAGSPYTVEFEGSLADTAVPRLTTDGAGLTPAGTTVTSAIETQGGEGWGTAKSVPCEHPDAGEIPKDDAETPVHAQISEHLEAGASYRFRLAATVGGKLGGAVRSAVASFAVPHAPLVSATAASDVTSTFARLSAEVNPLGADATYQFEYLSEEQFNRDGESWAGALVAPAAPADVGSGGEAGRLAEAVVQSVGGLQPATTYRFRAVASNEAGATEGEAAAGGGEVAHMFATQPAISSGLPDGRAYELVTPADKEGAEDMFSETFGDPLSGSSQRGVSSESGDQFLLNAHFAGFGPFPASGGNLYLFSRRPVADHPERVEWSYTSLVSPTLGQQSLLEETVLAVEPADFSRVAVGDGVGAPEGSEGVADTSLLGPPGGPYTVLHADQRIHFETGNPRLEKTEVANGSRDLGVVVLESNNPALAEGGCAHNSCPTPSVSHLDVWEGGELSPLEPQGDLCGAYLGGTVVGAAGEATGTGDDEEHDDGAVSADGSKIFFTAPEPDGPEGVKGCPTKSGQNPPELYMRSGEETTEISAPEAGAPEHRAGHGAFFVSASEDGSRMFFTSEGELTGNDAGIHDLELYEYETATGQLTRVSAGDSGDVAGGVVQGGFKRRGAGVTYKAEDIDVSSDGSHVYFVASGVLAPANAEGRAPKEGEENYYVYDALSGHTAFIAATNAGVDYAGPEVTSDGRFVLFQGEDGQLYRYDAQTEALTCVSCGPGASGGLLVPPSVMEYQGHTENYVLPPHSISEDGAYVFFNTTASLVPQDTNGALDVYEWHEGHGISLLSSGQDHLPSYFLGASPDGANVFFGTHARLVAADSSGGGNVYDARICEPERGNPCIEPPPAQEGLCEGDACAHPPAAPSDATPASLTFAGAGDLSPAPPAATTTRAKGCAKGRRLSHGRCVKRKSKKAKPKGKKARVTGTRGAKSDKRRSR